MLRLSYAPLPYLPSSTCRDMSASSSSHRHLAWSLRCVVSTCGHCPSRIYIYNMYRIFHFQAVVLTQREPSILRNRHHVSTGSFLTNVGFPGSGYFFMKWSLARSIASITSCVVGWADAVVPNSATRASTNSFVIRMVVSNI